MVVAIRSHQRILSDRGHLERCCDGSCCIKLNVSMVREAMPLLGVRGLDENAGASSEDLAKEKQHLV